MGIDDEILIGHVGRFSYQKNHEFILKIATELKNKNMKAKILLVGEGPEYERIIRLVKQLKLEKWLIFYGVASNVNDLYSAMDVFILPSNFEGLPLVGVEAQASGLPCIFSDKVSKEVKLTENVCFLGIKDKDVTMWVNMIKSYSSVLRIDLSEEIVKKHYCLEETIQNFLRLYQERT